MNVLSTEKRVRVIAALVEGNSIRATVRMTGVAKNTITKLLRAIGVTCSEYQDRTLRNLSCRRLQVDEMWSFCYCKSKNVPLSKAGVLGIGDVWTWVAIDDDTKLVPSFMVGDRGSRTAGHFMHYKSCPKHQTLGMTPAQAAGVADHKWTIEESVGLVDSN